MTCQAQCPIFAAFQPGPTAEEINRAYFAKRRARYLADAAAAIKAGRSWPIGSRFGFPTIQARQAHEKKIAAELREACGESAVEELRREVNPTNLARESASVDQHSVVGGLNP